MYLLSKSNISMGLISSLSISNVDFTSMKEQKYVLTNKVDMNSNYINIRKSKRLKC